MVPKKILLSEVRRNTNSGWSSCSVVSRITEQGMCGVKVWQKCLPYVFPTGMPLARQDFFFFE